MVLVLVLAPALALVLASERGPEVVQAWMALEVVRLVDEKAWD